MRFCFVHPLKYVRLINDLRILYKKEKSSRLNQAGAFG